jgi:hypothetical protein
MKKKSLVVSVWNSKFGRFYAQQWWWQVTGVPSDGIDPRIADGIVKVLESGKAVRLRRTPKGWAADIAEGVRLPAEVNVDL